jgi:aminoglycoside phosphotransferase (APT) family kinase protein
MSVSVSYSTIKAASAPDAMAEILATRVIGPVLPSVRVKGVKTKQGRRFEAPRVLWNVYEARLETAEGTEQAPLFWTKAYFNDRDCEEYRTRINNLLVSQSNNNPLDPRGHVRFFEDLNLFLFFFPTDPVFPALGTVFDPQAMQPLLADDFSRLGGGGAVRSLTAERVRYLPEIACIVRYQADLGKDEPATIYGKVQHSRRGALTYEVMKALWDLPARASGELVVAEPLAYHRRLDLLLQSALPGVEVEGDRHSDVFKAQCDTAGRTLGYIHSSGIRAGEPHTVGVEIGRLRNRLEEFKLSSPSVYFMLRDLLKQISAKAERISPETPVPSHGDYKYNQFLYDGEKFGLIDVEFFVQAEPSFDLGKYCGHLAPSVPKHWSDTIEANEGRRIFLDAYRAVRPDYKGARFCLYEALSLATRALVVTWSQSKGWEYTAQTLIALAYERLKTRWGE